MTARQKFKKGESVVCLAPGDKWRLGTVVGFGLSSDFVVVRKDGNKHPSTWNMTFWRKVRPSDRKKLLAAAKVKK